MTDIHVSPVNDLRDHDQSETCWCHPVEIFEGDVSIWVHNSMDGREHTKELCGWLRSMLPASGFAPTENWAPWLGADRIEALEAENERLREVLRSVTPPAHFGESEQSKTWWAKARAALGEKQ